MLKVCCGVTNEKEKDEVYERPGWLRSEGPRETGLGYELSVRTSVVRLLFESSM